MDQSKLDLIKFFSELESEIYVVFKLSDKFPDYSIGSDIDILCHNANDIAKKILNVGNKYLEGNYKVVVNANDSRTSVQIDYYEKDSDQINFRFDLLQMLPAYKKVSINPAYFFSVLEDRKEVTIKQSKSSTKLYVPSDVDDLVLRYLEYLEYFEVRPEKVKHLEYIVDKIENSKLNQKFLDRLHLYLKPRLMEIPKGSYFQSQLILETNDKLSEITDKINELNDSIQMMEQISDTVTMNQEVITDEINKVNDRITNLSNTRLQKILFYLTHPGRAVSRIFRR